MVLSLLSVALTLGVAASPAGAELPEIYSNNAWGSRGAFHVQAARPVKSGAMALSVAELYTDQSHFLAPTDSDSSSTLRINALWSPTEGFEMALRALSRVNKYMNGLGVDAQVQGDPSLLLKYSAPMTEAWGLGGVAIVSVPTSPSGNGLAGNAFSVNVAGLASLRAHEYVDVSANLGYIYDKSSALFSPSQLSPVNRYTYGISSAPHRATYGIAATAALTPIATFGISPFVELWGQYTGDVSLGKNPLAMTLGVKAFPAVSRWGEATVGTDVRLTGAPNATLPGLPSWRFFAQIALRFGESTDMDGKIAVPRCDEEHPCDNSHSCEDHACVRVAVRDVAPVCKPTELPQMVALSGKVTDARSGQPIERARVYVSGQRGPSAVNPNSGEFALCPIAAGDGVVKIRVEASGYRSSDQVVPRNKQSETSPLEFALRRGSETMMGILRGSVLSATTGKLVEGVSIVIPAAQMSLEPAPDGSFEVSLKVGRYEAMVSAPGYETQKKSMVIHIDEVMIWNVDLRPAKGTKKK